MGRDRPLGVGITGVTPASRIDCCPVSTAGVGIVELGPTVRSSSMGYQQLRRERHLGAIATQQRQRRRHAATGAGTADSRRAGSTAGQPGQPRQRGIAVVQAGRVKGVSGPGVIPRAPSQFVGEPPAQPIVLSRIARHYVATAVDHNKAGPGRRLLQAVQPHRTPELSVNTSTPSGAVRPIRQN